MRWWLWNAFFVLLLTTNNYGASQTIIKNLPGLSGDLPFKLETGYVGLGDLDELQLFYYFVESERSPENDPLLLWITGGPRCSSFCGLVFEIGPIAFKFENLTKDPLELVLNQYSWTKVANIIFLDAPAGTGFSYSTTSEGYNTSDTMHARRAYEFLQRWLMTHPKFLANPLYISGDSYSGKIAPIIVQEIINGIDAGMEPPLNLKGYIIGNPITNVEEDINSRIRYAHHMALISDRIYESTKKNCKGNYVDVDPKNLLCLNNLEDVEERIGRLDLEHILAAECVRSMNEDDLTILQTNWDSSHDTFIDFPFPSEMCRGDRIQYVTKLANNVNIRKALNVREGKKEEWVRCNTSIPYTYDVSRAVDYHRSLTQRSLRAIVYSGDHDMKVPYTSTLAWIESLNLTIHEDWKPWFSNDQIAGYKSYYTNKDYHLTYATVKGGGHTAPEYNPRECFDMINRWLAHSPL